MKPSLHIPAPIRSQEDVPPEVQKSKLTLDDSVHLEAFNLWVVVGRTYLFAGHQVKVEQIIRKAPFEESESSWGMVQVLFLQTRQRCSFVFSAEWAQHLQIDPTVCN